MSWLWNRFSRIDLHHSLSSTASGGRGGLRDQVDQLRERMKGKTSDATKNTWDSLWKDGVTPWDLGKATPLLITELEKRGNLLPCSKRWKSLVPGCGVGYDLVTLVQHQNAMCSTPDIVDDSRDSLVVGLDISLTSLERAKENLLQNGAGRGKTQVKLQRGDFFEDKTSWDTFYDSSNNVRDNSKQTAMQFDFILDYTFFSALPPSLRRAWATRMKELLVPDKGRLMTIIFPILPEADVSVGPPYPVTLSDYQKVLEPEGVQMECEPFSSPDSVPSRAGKELICYWRC